MVVGIPGHHNALFRKNMNWLVDPFLSNPFMLRALLAGILVSISCGIVGTYIVLHGLAFMGDALAHGVLPGIAVAILLGIPGIIGASIGAVVMIGGISLITNRSRLSSDTAIGLLFVGMLALGVVIVSRSTTFTGDIVRVLFGEILGINSQAILLQTLATLAIAGTALICARPFLLHCFNPEQAQVSGFSSNFYHNIMLAMIAVAVIVSFQTVGTMLVFGMLLAPAGAGALIAQRIEVMMAWAAVIGAFSVFTGLLISYHFNLAAGSSIVLVTTIVFFGTLAIKNIQLFRNRKVVKVLA
jgi:ABC-type Mn2+/Zn2+ transport system permease subunit